MSGCITISAFLYEPRIFLSLSLFIPEVLNTARSSSVVVWISTALTLPRRLRSSPIDVLLSSTTSRYTPLLPSWPARLQSLRNGPISSEPGLCHSPKTTAMIGLLLPLTSPHLWAWSKNLPRCSLPWGWEPRSSWGVASPWSWPIQARIRRRAAAICWWGHQTYRRNWSLQSESSYHAGFYGFSQAELFRGQREGIRSKLKGKRIFDFTAKN